ncbi:MAG: hypothetical protein DMG84_13510 [Acidobacteria bacterium]|nr:MAG: hypothetical protein DMG85_10150 [Acidobacteriota bacterium]PYX14902.1 MAG: hypothetical protein DMG84_13510 [Acidobacteriota bacterium]
MVFVVNVIAVSAGTTASCFPVAAATPVPAPAPASAPIPAPLPPPTRPPMRAPAAAPPPIFTTLLFVWLLPLAKKPPVVMGVIFPLISTAVSLSVS